MWCRLRKVAAHTIVTNKRKKVRMERFNYKSKADIPPDMWELLREMGDDDKSLEEMLTSLNERLQYLDGQDKEDMDDFDGYPEEETKRNLSRYP